MHSIRLMARDPDGRPRMRAFPNYVADDLTNTLNRWISGCSLVEQPLCPRGGRRPAFASPCRRTDELRRQSRGRPFIGACCPPMQGPLALGSPALPGKCWEQCAKA